MVIVTTMILREYLKSIYEFFKQQSEDIRILINPEVDIGNDTEGDTEDDNSTDGISDSSSINDKNKYFYNKLNEPLQQEELDMSTSIHTDIVLREIDKDGVKFKILFD